MVHLKVAACVAATLATIHLQGCGSGGGDDGGGGSGESSTAAPDSRTTPRATTQAPPPVTTTRDPNACPNPAHSNISGQCFYKCESDLQFPVAASSKKGLDLDDTTLEWCPDNMHFHWPNTNEPVTSFRMFKAWAPWWDFETPTKKTEAWEALARFLKASRGQVLVGTQISCNETEDDADWENVKAMVQVFGPEHIMGLAVGNELELLWTKGSIIGDEETLNACLDKVWTQQYFLKKFHERVREFDALGAGFRNVKVTSVFGGFILARPGWPFYERSDKNVANVLTFLQNATAEYGDRYAHTLNIYPYFEPKALLDDASQHPPTCEEAIRRSMCFETDEDGTDFSDDMWSSRDCVFTWMIRRMRQRLDLLGTPNATLWIGETGWSYPKAHTLDTQMQWCDDWSSTQSFTEYYSNFLQWDLTMKGKYRGPDHVFYFSMRDSSNFGITEGFGLVGDGDNTKWCSNTTCKMQQSSWTPRTTTKTTTTVSTRSTTRGPTTPKPPQCCWSRWGTDEECGLHPVAQYDPLCSDGVTPCQTANDCAATPAPAPPSAPTTVPPTTVSPTTVSPTTEAPINHTTLAMISV